MPPCGVHAAERRRAGRCDQRALEFGGDVHGLDGHGRVHRRDGGVVLGWIREIARPTLTERTDEGAQVGFARGEGRLGRGVDGDVWVVDLAQAETLARDALELHRHRFGRGEALRRSHRIRLEGRERAVVGDELGLVLPVLRLQQAHVRQARFDGDGAAPGPELFEARCRIGLVGHQGVGRLDEGRIEAHERPVARAQLQQLVGAHQADVADPIGRELGRRRPGAALDDLDREARRLEETILLRRIEPAELRFGDPVELHAQRWLWPGCVARLAAGGAGNEGHDGKQAGQHGFTVLRRLLR